ncbi:MAG: alpha/beta hydrolase [Planctomycetota bacterium]
MAELDVHDSPETNSSAEVPRKSLSEYLEQFDAMKKDDFFDGPRYRVGYSVLGEGPPLYIVQGICCTRRLYASLAVELAEHFRVVLYDLAGVGDGDGADMRAYHLDDYPRDLFALADHVGDRTFGVIGNSFGTTVTVRAMVAEPSRIPRAMLCCGFSRRPLTWFERLTIRMFGYMPGRLWSVPLANAISRYNHGPELDRREKGLTEFLIVESGRTPTRTAAAQALAVDATDLSSFKPRLQQPVLIFHGEQDRLVHPKHAAELAAGIENVHLMMVPGCGHIPQLSHPELMARRAAIFSTPCSTASCPGAEVCQLATDNCGHPHHAD